MKKQKPIHSFYNRETSLDIANTNNRKDASREHKGVNPPSKRRKYPLSDAHTDPLVSQLTQDSTSSVADAVVTGAITGLRSMSSQASEASIMQGQSATSDRSNQRSTVEKEFEVSDQKLERLLESEQSRRAILPRVEHLKQKAHHIAEMCRESRVKGKSNLLEKFCTECDRYKKAYETSYDAVKKSGSSDQDSLIKDLRHYQQAVLLLSKFSLNNLEEAQPEFIYIEDKEKFDKQMAKYTQFIKQISDEDIFTHKQKQQMLAKYHGMFQECKDKLEDLQKELAKKDISHNILELARNINYIKRDMIALGKIIESDCLQRDANIPHLQAIQEGTEKYMQAFQSYQSCEKEAKKLELSKNNKLKLVWQRLGKMVKCVEELQRKYTELTESAMDTLKKDKGKGHVVDSLLADLVDDRGETISDTKHLESAEYRMERIKRIYKSGMQNVVQGKLEIYLRDPKYLSPKEIRYVGRKLSQQLMDIRKMVLQSVDQDQRANLTKIYDDSQIAGTYEFFKDKKNLITEKAVRELFNLIKRHQKATCKQIKGEVGKMEYNKEFRIFKQQIEQCSKLRKTNMTIEAYKADIRAKELGCLFLREIKSDGALAHTTFAVAFMQDPQTEEILSFVSINEGALDTQIQTIRQKYIKEHPTIIWLPSKGKSIEGRHAEHVLIDYAEAHSLKIVGIGASRPFCGNCCELLEKKVDQQARGQIISSGPGRKRSSTHRRGSRVGAGEGGTADLRGVKWDSESDHESSDREMNASNDQEVQKISQAGRIESAEQAGQKHSQAEHTERSRRSGDRNAKETKLPPDERLKLEAALHKHVREWLGPLGRDEKGEEREIILKGFDYLAAFNDQNGHLCGTTNIPYLLTKNPQAIAMELGPGRLVEVWSKSRLSSKKWTRAIPQEGQTPTWYIPHMYALRKNGNGPIYVMQTKKAIQELSTRQAVKKITNGNEVDGWKCIKHYDQIKETDNYLIVNPEQRGQQDIPSYNKLVNDETPGLYLVNHKKKMRAYWPISTRDINEKFGLLAGIGGNIAGKKHLLIKGNKIDGWEREHYIEFPTVEVKSPRGHDYTFDRQKNKSKLAYKSHVVVFSENGTLRPREQVPDIGTFYQILRGNKQSWEEWKRLPAKKNETPYEKIVIWEGIDVDRGHQGDATVKPKRQKRKREQ